MRTSDPALAGLLAALLLPLGAAADGPHDIASMPLGDLLDAPIAAASLEPERRSEAAAATFVLTADDLRAFGFVTLGDALAAMPGMFGYRDDFFSMAGVRGLGALMDYGTRIIVLVDGHSLNDSLGLGGTLLGRDLPVPMAAVKRIELVKGPVGSLYGDAAFLAVVNVVTHDPDDRASEVSVAGSGAPSGGQGAEASAVLTATLGPVGVTAAADLYGSRHDTLRLPELLEPTGARAAATDPRVRGRDGAGSAYLRLGLGGTTLSGACAEEAGRTVTAAYASIIGDPRNTISSRHCFAELAWRGPVSPGLELSARAGYDLQRFTDGFAYAPPPDDVGVARDLGVDRWASADVRLTARPTAATRLVLGGTAQQHRTLQRVYADGVPSTVEDPVNGFGPGDIRKDFLTLNAYAQADQTLFEVLRLQASATLHHHELYGTRLTPKLAAVWTPSPGNAVKAIYSEGFRAPTMSEAFYDDGVTYLANPRLDPETVRAGELILDRRLAEGASVSASFHTSRYDQLIRFVTVPAPDGIDPGGTRQQGVNQGHLHLVGAELSGTVRLGRWLRGHGGLAWQRAATRPVNFPSWTGNLALATRVPWEPLTLAAVLRGASARAKDAGNPGAGAPRVGAALRLDLQATLEIPRAAGLVAAFSVTNVLGTAGGDPLLADNAPVSELPAPPRRFQLRLGYHFQ
ncbi:MAG: TonB-dependent receptor [Anaeromyxobacteraceae bacterium]